MVPNYMVHQNKQIQTDTWFLTQVCSSTRV